MATHVVLMKLTDQGIKDIKNAHRQIEAVTKTLEADGGKLTNFYATTGEYDYVAIAQTPSDEVGLTFVLGLCSTGNVRTTTLLAFTKEQFAEMVNKLP